MYNSKKRILSVIVSVVMLISALFVFNSVAVAATEEKTAIISCSDFQPTQTDGGGSTIIKNILSKIEENGIN
ncbi:MAG: hypothetical protein IIW73_03635 [Clostridia bacterium]|nr:hypothetical protein [Clostridia bacterium]